MTRFVDHDGRALAGRQLFGVLYRRAVEANVVGAALAFVDLAFIPPPQPPPPYRKGFLLLAVAPFYVMIAALVGYRSASGGFAPSTARCRAARTNR